MTTRDRTPSPPPSAPGMCMRLSTEPPEPSMPPVTMTGQWSPPTPVLSTVRARLRSGTGIGRGYGILRFAAEREPSPPASRSLPPLPSDSEDDLSDVTVIDIGLETDAAVPGSPTAAASLDRAAAMASATLSSTATAEGASADETGITTSIDHFEEAAENLRHTFQTAHNRDVLVELMMSMTTARVAVATEFRDEAVQRVGDGQEESAAFLELIRHLDDVRYCRPRSD